MMLLYVTMKKASTIDADIAIVQIFKTEKLFLTKFIVDHILAQILGLQIFTNPMLHKIHIKFVK